MDSDEIKLIATEDISLSDLPIGRMNWHKFSFFALTFDPLSERLTDEELAEIGEKGPRTEHGVKVLRAFLYNWQRIWNNGTSAPPPSFFVKVHRVVELIRAKLNE